MSGLANRRCWFVVHCHERLLPINDRIIERIIAYLQDQDRILKKRLGGRRLRLTDAERSRLARKAHALGYKRLHTLETLVTPDTLMRWYRQLIARKWDSRDRRRSGRR